MQKMIVNLPEIKLIGIKCRTNNKSEQDPNFAKIGATIQQYFQTNAAERISNRKNPNTTYCAYTDYENDQNGDYTYFVGEEVSTFSDIQEGMFKLIIPSQEYIKFTNGPGVMPVVCIDVWQKIWGMTPADFEGSRSYLTDFEIYDSRAVDRDNTVLDVYVGIN